MPLGTEASEAVLKLPEGEAGPTRIEYLYDPIDDLREADVAIASVAGETRLARVVRMFQRRSDHPRHMVLQSSAGSTQHIETTDEHPACVPSAGYFVPAGKLHVGDTLRGPLGERLYLIETSYEQHAEGIAVYNFEVVTLHTYYTTAHGARARRALVHNMCRDVKVV